MLISCAIVCCDSIELLLRFSFCSSFQFLYKSENKNKTSALYHRTKDLRLATYTFREQPMQNTLIQTQTCLLPQITRELRHQLLITFRRCFSSGPFARSLHAEFPPSSALYGSKGSVTLPESIEFIVLIIKLIYMICQ